MSEKSWMVIWSASLVRTGSDSLSLRASFLAFLFFFSFLPLESESDEEEELDELEGDGGGPGAMETQGRIGLVKERSRDTRSITAFPHRTHARSTRGATSVRVKARLSLGRIWVKLCVRAAKSRTIISRFTRGETADAGTCVHDGRVRGSKPDLELAVLLLQVGDYLLEVGNQSLDVGLHVGLQLVELSHPAVGFLPFALRRARPPAHTRTEAG